MKKFIAISAIAVSLFAVDYQVGTGFGRAHTDKYSGKYNFLNLRIGTFLSKFNLLRLEVERSTNYDFDNSKNNLTRALLNLEHEIDINSKITPYIFIGTGYQWVSNNDQNAMVIDAGIGAKYNVIKNLDLFVETRALRDFGIEKNHLSLLGGLVYNFGGEEEPEAAPLKEEPKVIDSDEDGVSDNLDKCPNTPVGVKVDKRGCPIDSDEDGVPDYLDKCPHTPANVKVDKNGCALDSDGDGVADYLDKCPNTPKGMKVDKSGCAVSFNFEINFDTNSAKIKSQYMEKIKKFAEFLKQHPDIKAEIQGYTDNKGNYKYNIVLSEKRAKAVYEALLKLGVDKNQITWAGYGPNNPIASNDTAEGRAKNRRVIAKIIY
ncbi:OmpA-OmpF porin, OOP family [Lebetimonas natsushimae]|uniref:OmpA-OmpF porin, OOP family n=1 Tax=Lebetimonas natsushimae TaxID=1936991 RepID=A0A292YF97_9BACT|nr:OmpA family protein [Lebetimonas natsushimae]GAX87740.1 OmpA-OmpF porin, OOP family [Lebetimonas natsushimae]